MFKEEINKILIPDDDLEKWKEILEGVMNGSELFDFFYNKNEKFRDEKKSELEIKLQELNDELSLFPERIKQRINFYNTQKNNSGESVSFEDDLIENIPKEILELRQEKKKLSKEIQKIKNILDTIGETNKLQ